MATTRTKYWDTKSLFFTCASLLAFDALAELPTFSIEAISPDDAQHIDPVTGAPDAYTTHENDDGDVLGSAARFGAGGSDLGSSAWIWDGSSTSLIGFIDAEHTRSTDGFRDTNSNPFRDVFDSQGRAAGASVRFLPDGSSGGNSAWYYDGNQTTSIGFVDALHTRDGYRVSNVQDMSETGFVVGSSTYYASAEALPGSSAWLYNGTTSLNIGLTAGDFTHPTGLRSSNTQAVNSAGQAIGYSTAWPDGWVWPDDSYSVLWLWSGGSHTYLGLSGAQYLDDRGAGEHEASLSLLTDSGFVAGESRVFGSAGTVDLGQDTWLYDGTDHTHIGLTSSDYRSVCTNPAYTGRRGGEAKFLNEAGFVAGSATLYKGECTHVGADNWLYNGTTSVRINPADALHTDTKWKPGGRYSTMLGMNAAGQVIGRAERYSCPSYCLPDAGESAWVYDGTSTIILGLIDTTHTGDDGYKRSGPAFINETGQVTGWSLRYAPDGTELGQSGWFYDGTTVHDIGGLGERSDGYRDVSPRYLGEDGTVLGSYELFDALDNSLGERAFIYTVADGMIDLGTLVPDFDDWDSLEIAEYRAAEGQIIGLGYLNGDAGTTAFLLTPLEITEVVVDVNPWGPNEVSPDSTVILAVGVKTTSIGDGDASDFDATQVDAATLKLGPDAAPNVATPWAHDFDGDTDVDMVFGFQTNDTGIACDDVQISLSGQTFAGESFAGVDTITTIDCDTASCHP